ncbi:unnamed protein product [Adineta steineri]|uniref:Death domain-containing protein n=1 Tax=Adineta steineri TaxID=433720 RepID=A0A814LFA8_9BILA|nr:unnamed protein product [Adineta steineri]
MDEFIRQLTHDNTQFDNQWPDTFTKLHKLPDDIPDIDQPTFKVKSLNALVDYVLEDNEAISGTKSIFIDKTIQNLLKDPLPSLDELVQIFCRVLNIPNTNKLLQIKFLQKFYYQYRLGERLSKSPSVELIDSILGCLQKHELLNKESNDKVQDEWKQFLTRSMFSPLDMDTNKINHKETMIIMRSHFQHLYRWAAHHSRQSTIWSDVLNTLERACPTLFDSFITPDDAKVYLNTCAEPSISTDYCNLIAKSYQSQADLFTANSSDIFIIVEKLLSQNKIKEAQYFVRNVIVTHFSLINNLEELLQMLIRACPLVDIQSRNYFCKDIISPIAYEMNRKKANKKLATSYFDLILAILDLIVIEALPCAYRILEINEFYPWKQLDKQLTHLVQSCVSYDKIISNSGFSDLDILEKIIKLIGERAKTNPTILRATHQSALQAILKWSSIIDNDTGKPYDKHIFNMGTKMTELVDIKQITIDNCYQFIAILQKQINDNDDTYVLDKTSQYFFTAISQLLSESIQHIKTIPTALHQQLATFCSAALDCSLHDENGGMTFEHLAALHIWFKVGQCIDNEDNARVYETCLDRLYKLIYDEEEEEKMYSWWCTFWSMTALKYPNVAANHISQFLHEIIDHKKMNLLGLLPTLYAKRPEPFHDRLDDLVHALFDDNGQHLVSIASILMVIIKTHPELITSSQVDYLFTSIKNHTDILNESSHIFLMLGHIANAQPHLLDKYRQDLVHFVTEQQKPQAFNCLQQYLVASTIINGEKTVDENLILLINLIKNSKNISTDLSSQIFHTCQLIGIRHKQILATKRNDLLPFESNSTCRMLIDIIDGNKMSEENQTAINHTLDEIAQIERRVVHTEQGVQNITKLVKRQELNITNLDARVNTVDTHINDINEQLEHHAHELERIDAKTLSYVPTEWGRDVCTLLNVRANNDWRLLGKRFGYSTSELKHWAMQLDPTMSLLNEWFMTHKADEATYGLVKMLNEIGRQDAEQIIRKAMSNAGELIPDDLPMDIKRLPPIFLSYQWGSQKAVGKLKTNLEQAGYSCWMDTGEMGGGDKLFAKIDAGIRGAKVVICCINKNYAQSDNCSREVHLTISTGKPLIPLQMEKQSWPPEGALGPIMSEYLYIRFFDRKSNDENYWPADKFTELLGQIRYHVAPDPDMITEQYHNWFVPRVDNLIFLQPTTTTPTATTTTTTKNDKKDKAIINDDTPLVITHPQVMISYQWDYQNDIIILYNKLTQLGYRCWLDIFQMGGGDSLFEKIDTGIRHAKCIISCVTPKYTKSINCRREMALADALEKLILPLLIEDTKSWPPAGPMAMVFAERSYIDFRNPKPDQQRWSGKEFESVLAKLKQAIPEVQTEKPQRHLLDMQRPTTAIKRNENKLKRIRSAPIIPESRACSIM